MTLHSLWLELETEIVNSSFRQHFNVSSVAELVVYFMSREDLKVLKEYISRVLPRKKLGYMRKKGLYGAGVGSGV
jgi:hypothetical protein